MKSVNKFLVILLIILLSNKLYSQTNISFDISTGYDDNIFLSPVVQKDFLTDASVKFTFHTKDTALNYYFVSNYFSFLNNSDRNIFINNVGLTSYKRLGRGENYFFFGGDLLNRLNRIDYNYYNYNQLTAYANMMFRHNQSTLRTGYNIRYRSYINLSELSNLQQYLFANYNISFPTRTTFILESNLGIKSFNGVDQYTSGGSGRGKNSFSHVIEGEKTNLGHIIFTTRIAQSLSNRQGVFIQYKKQISLFNSFDYINSDEFYQDEELFDDPFSYESSTYSIQLSSLFSSNIMVRLGDELSFKNYISEFAYESSEDSIGTGSLREDLKNSLFLNFSKQYFPKDSWYNSLKIYAQYSFINNKSNSYWYDFKNNSINFGLTLIF